LAGHRDFNSPPDDNLSAPFPESGPSDRLLRDQSDGGDLDRPAGLGSAASFSTNGLVAYQPFSGGQNSIIEVTHSSYKISRSISHAINTTKPYSVFLIHNILK